MLKTNGIVVKSMKYGESSLIIDILTKNEGVKTFIVGGVRTKKKNTSSIYHPLQQLELVHYPAKDNAMARIKEAKLSKHYDHLLTDVVSTSLANFLIECMFKVAKEVDINSVFYNLMANSLDYIDEHPKECGNYHIFFLIELATISGYEMENNYSEVNAYFHVGLGRFVAEAMPIGDYLPDADTSRRHAATLNQPWSTVQQLTLSRDAKHQLLELLIQYLIYHIPAFSRPKSLDVFKIVFG